MLVGPPARGARCSPGSPHESGPGLRLLAAHSPGCRAPAVSAAPAGTPTAGSGVVPGRQFPPPASCGASCWRSASSRAEHSGASRRERKSTTWKSEASWRMALVTSADLPMPPRPSTLTTRQCSCTIHCPRWPVPLLAHRSLDTTSASPQSTRGPTRRCANQADAADFARSGEAYLGPMVQSVLCSARLESQSSSRSTFWWAAFHKARISSPSRPAAKACCLHGQGQDLFEVLSFGITAAGLPLRHRAPGDAEPIGQVLLVSGRCSCVMSASSDRKRSLVLYKRTFSSEVSLSLDPLEGNTIKLNEMTCQLINGDFPRQHRYTIVYRVSAAFGSTSLLG